MKMGRRKAGTVFSGGKKKGGTMMDVKQYNMGGSLRVPSSRVSRNSRKLFGKGM